MVLTAAISADAWVAIGIAVVAQFGVLIGIHIRAQIKLNRVSDNVERLDEAITEVKEELKSNRSSLNLDKMQNETTFTRIWQRLEDATVSLTECKTILREREHSYDNKKKN